MRAGAEAVTLARLRHVYKVYRVADTGVVALAGVDLDLARGEFLAVVGPSGSGKSTLLNLLGGLDRPTAGVVEVDGRDLARLAPRELAAYRRERVGFVWQGTARNLVPYLTVRDNVALAAVARGVVVAARRGSVDELLDLVGLRDRARHRPAQLSGGEQQRAAVAVALANAPDLLLADEPTAELDSASAARVLDVLRAANRDLGTTVVMVTHDLTAAARADRTIRLRDGRLVAEPLPLGAVSPDGRIRLPDQALAAIGDGELEAEVRGNEVRIRPRDPGIPGGHARHRWTGGAGGR
ncbi:MAG TPA: ABC transporter ATP-binding protein [Actinomycetota bacterium]|nr:ABC transporter ATP-binding protein [Actinomycetota bacterium]